MKLLPSSAALIALLISTLFRGPALAAPAARLLPDFGVAAANGPKLVVLPVGLDRPSKEQERWLTDAAEQAIIAAGRFTLVPVAEVGTPAAELRAAKAVEAEALMKSAHQSLDDLDAQKAIAQFTEALALWRQSDLIDPSAWNNFILAWVMKAASQVANGETAAAKAEIERILTVCATAKFPDAFFPPDLLKLVEVQRKSVSRATGELLIRTDPAGANVWVDGVPRAPSPTKTSRLSGGKHLIVVSMPGFDRVTTEMNLGDELLRLKPSEGAGKLKAAQDKVAKSPDGPGRDAAGREWASLVAGAEQALVLIAKKSTTGQKLELTAIRLEGRDGHNLGYQTGIVAVADDKALAGFLDGVLAKDARRDGKKPVTNFGGSAGASTVRTATGIALIGIAAAALGTGIFAGVSANGKANAFRNTPQVATQQSANLAAEGKSFALMADVTIIGGAIAAAAGTVVLLTGGKSTGGDGPSSENSSSETRKNAAGATKPQDAPKVDRVKNAEDASKGSEAMTPSSSKDGEGRSSDEAKRAEEPTAADEAKKADEARKTETTRREAAKRKADEEKKADDARRKAEEERKRKFDEDDLRNY